MPTFHRIRQGETLVAISERHGFFVDTIWNAAENTDLRNRRRDKNALLPGDVLFIPDKRIVSVNADVDRRHVFKRKGIPARLRVQIAIAGEVRANEAFRLVLEGTSREDIEGTTNGRGVVDVLIPASARRVSLWLGDDVHPIVLSVGHMDPLEEPSGVAKRLVNLGYMSSSADVTDDDGRYSKHVVRAIKRFQIAHDLEPTGELDDDTKSALSDMHDTESNRST